MTSTRRAETLVAAGEGAATPPLPGRGPVPTPLLEITGLCKTFPGVRALRDLDLTVHDAEVLGLVGQNGCGKSTLIKILSGYHSPDSGSHARFGTEEIDLGSAAAAAEHGIAFVHQDLGLVAELSVMENLAVATGFPTRLGRIAWRRLRARTQDALRTLGYELDVRAPVSALSASERVAVAIARAMMHDGEHPLRLLVLDEPTASLPQNEVDLLFATVRRLQGEGVAVIFVSHRLDEVFAVCDRVAVMRDGRTVATKAVQDLTTPQLVELMLGHAIEPAAVAPGVHGRDGEPALVAEGLSGGTLEHLDLVAHRGEVLGVAGLTGSGREAVAPLLFGGTPMRGGVLKVGDRTFKRIKPSGAKRLGLALVPAERRQTALLFDGVVRENLLLAGLRSVSRLGVVRAGAERRETGTWIDKLGVKAPGGEFPISNLSGGNQQKVVLARWLRMNPSVLILDEPTQGVDVGAKQEIYQHLREIAAHGTAVIVCSTDSEEIVAVSDRALVISRGRVHSELSGAGLTINALNHQIAAA